MGRWWQVSCEPSPLSVGWSVGCFLNIIFSPTVSSRLLSCVISHHVAIEHYQHDDGIRFFFFFFSCCHYVREREKDDLVIIV